MVFEVKGRTALVTGGTEGIGLAIVERLLDMGARVMVANRNVKLAEKVIPELRSKKHLTEKQLSFVKMDMSSLEDIKKAFDTSLKFADGDLSIIVANAGFSTDVFVRDVKQAHDADWINGIQGNLVGTIYLGRLALTEWLKKDTLGAFVVTSSVAGIHGMYSLEGWRTRAHGSSIYPVVKAGQVSYVENTQLMLETRAKTKKMPRANQRFTAVMPGAVWTNIWKMESKEDVIKAGLTVENWVPMDKLVDCFIDCITNESRRGSSWVVAGSAGKAVRYPKEVVVDQELFYERSPEDKAKQRNKL